jgi:hypothetical protein
MGCDADFGDVAHWVPADPVEVYFPATFELGVSGADYGTLFQGIVATPRGLRSLLARRQDIFLWEGCLVVLPLYSWAGLQGVICRICDGCRGQSEEEVIQKLSRFFQWEHEDEIYVE